MSEAMDGGECTICHEPIPGDGAPEYGDLLSHLAGTHPRSEILRDAVAMMELTITCSGCGETFQSGVNVAQETGAFVTGSYCGSCIEDRPILGVHVRTLTGPELAEEHGMGGGSGGSDD